MILASLVTKIFEGILSIILKLVGVILLPVNLLISAVLPDLSGALDIVTDYFDYIKSFVPLVISYTGLNTTTIGIIESLLVFMLVSPPIVHGIKIALKWYNALKL